MEMNAESTASYLARTLASQRSCFFNKSEAKGLFDFQGRRGITPVVRWNLRPVMFGVDLQKKSKDTVSYMVRSLSGRSFSHRNPQMWGRAHVGLCAWRKHALLSSEL